MNHNRLVRLNNFSERRYEFLRDVVLGGKESRQLPVVTFGPEVPAVDGIDQPLATRKLSPARCTLPTST